jgi:hypothetical protein
VDERQAGHRCEFVDFPDAAFPDGLKRLSAFSGMKGSTIRSSGMDRDGVASVSEPLERREFDFPDHKSLKNSSTCR